MKAMIRIINFICSKASCHCQFKQFLLDVQAEYGDVVYHNDVRWPSRGSALQYFYSLRKVIGQFGAEKAQRIPELSDRVCLTDLESFVEKISKRIEHECLGAKCSSESISFTY